MRQKKMFLADRTGYYGNGYSISGYGISWFLWAFYDVTPPNLQKYVTDPLSTSQYLMKLAAVRVTLSSHFTMVCVMRSSTLLDDTSPLTAYTANPSSTRAMAYQKRRYFRGHAYYKHKVTSSFGSSEKSILTP